MDISAIPRSFWHALSLSLLIATCGLVYIAYRSSTVSIEIANAKIQLSSAIDETKDIKSDLEKENEALLRATTELKNKIAVLEQLEASTTVPQSILDEIKKLKSNSLDVPELGIQSLSAERFREVDSRIEEVRGYLK